MQNSQNYLQENTASTSSDSISLYTDNIATGKEIMQAVVAIKKSFPALPPGFYDVLDDRLRANNFTIQRLADAVSFVIDNCVYPTPTIANFISFDKILKYRSYDEMCKEALTYDKVWQDWVPIKMPNLPKTIWVFANDIQKYGLSKYQIV